MSTTVSEQPCSRVDDGGGEMPLSMPRQEWIERRITAATVARMQSFTGGRIHFDDGWKVQSFGTESADLLEAELKVQHPDFYRYLLTGGSIGFAEAYLDEHWSTDNLTTLLRILCRNMSELQAFDSGLQRLSRPLRRLGQWLAANTIAGSRRNIAAHYDLSNDFFELFLDPSLSYSAAYFEDESWSLERASIAKLEQVCRKLELKSTDHLLEIGTGWGAFALHAAQNYGCRLTTTTISQQQYAVAKHRASAAGLGVRVRLLAEDYRELKGQYDKLVSIEMIEAVGEKFLDLFFRTSARLLKPGGRFVLQGIVMPEQRYQSYRRSVDFIQKYIFPGGFLPSVAGMCESVGRTSDLSLQSIEDLSPHYALTLKHWRTRFLSRLDRVRELGFDDRFIRMWEYYLCYCEAAFRERAVRVVQIVWDKPE